MPVTTQLRSNFQRGTPRWAARRAQWLAMGLSEGDFEKPKIAIVNSSSNLSVRYAHLDALSLLAQEAVRKAEGLAFEVHTVAPSDFVTSAGLKTRYLLPSRDLIVNDVEVMVEGACLDGMILLSSCDKTTAGHLMAAARLNIPAIVVPCGYASSGPSGGRGAGGESTTDSGLNAANSMQCLAEALGLALSDSAPLRANSVKLRGKIAEAARQILVLIEKDIRPRAILTAHAIENAVRVAISLGASESVVRHLCAIAGEAEVDCDVIRLFEQNSGLPLLAQIHPNGPDRIEDLARAGGVRAILSRLRSKLHLGVATVNGCPLGPLLQEPIDISASIIKTLTVPFKAEPGLVILRGNLAPEGAIVKLSAVPEAVRVFEGRARIFEDEDEAIRQLGEGKIRRGDVVVLRMMGPSGSHGTVFGCSFMAALVEAKLAETVAVITDGEPSELHRGIAVSQIMPEAACGGPLAVIGEGEAIRIDLHEGKLELLISQKAITRRLGAWKKPVRKARRSWLSIYADVVQPISTGAVWGR